MVGNQVFTAISREAIISNRTLLGVAMGTRNSAALRQAHKFEFACAEIVCIQKALNAGVSPRGGVLRAVNIGRTGRGHNTPKRICDTCIDVKDFFGILGQ